ncbi:beta-xylosidase [Lachnospiraceae bacterium KM106-2]|nr:beta-xylosidase [Lachnospiraceae bacterium KM106-2]
MNYNNPVIRGMYPDPSACKVEGVYYLVNSSFEYMPGIPIFSSKDLVNWNQIGNCLVDPEAVGLIDCPNSGGIFAVTIRHHNDRFYIITTCFGKAGMRNFYMSASQPEGPWSDPVFINIDGIDPSFYWEAGHTYVQYTAFGKILQVEIDLVTGDVIKGPELLTTGCGGRDAEGPHIWKRNGFYYLLLAEGGTREGHMVTMLRSETIWGPYEKSPYLPVVSNRDYSREPLQSVGHADWLTDEDGNDYLIGLATRHVKHKTILGRETVLTPAYWTEDGWLRAENDFLPLQGETKFDGKQKVNHDFAIDMQSKELSLRVISPRKRHDELVQFKQGSMFVTGNDKTLFDMSDPVLLAVRQDEYDFTLESAVAFTPLNEKDEAGIAMYTDNLHHFSIFISTREGKKVLVMRKVVDDIVKENRIPYPDVDYIDLRIRGDKEKYYFEFSKDHKNFNLLDWSYNKHLSTACVNSPNTGVVGGIFVNGSQTAEFKKFTYQTLENMIENR